MASFEEIRKVIAPYFDAAFYLSVYPDVAAAATDPIWHYVVYGAAENRDPSMSFSTSYYRSMYRDVRETRQNPLYHYVTVGIGQGRYAKPPKSASSRHEQRFDPLVELEQLRARTQETSRLLEVMRTRTPSPKETAHRPFVGPPARALSARVASVPPVHPSDWWPSTLAPGFALSPPPGLMCQSLSGEPASHTAVLVFGLSGSALAEVVDMIALRQQRRMDLKPVFLTDCGDARIFVHHGYAFEYFASRYLQSGVSRSVNTYYRFRMSLLYGKWGFDATIDLSAEPRKTLDESWFGQPSTSVLHEQLASIRDAAVAPGWLEQSIALIRESGLFDIEWYSSNYPEVRDQDPIEHYLTVGAMKGYNPNPLFDTAYYARQILAILTEPAPDS